MFDNTCPGPESEYKWTHRALTVGSFAPSFVGSAFSYADGVVYSIEGDKAGAAISFAAGTAGVFGDSGAFKVAGTLAKDATTLGKEGRFVYRGLAEGEDISKGIFARAPGAGNSEIGHVAGKIESQWISTTKDEATALGKYGQYGAVRIDLSKVTSQISDVSKGFVNGGRLSSWAIRDSEVLIKDFIHPDAITVIK